jgi:fatty acid desaturase
MKQAPTFKLSRFQLFLEIVRPWFLLGLYVAVAWQGWWWLAVPLCFAVVLAGFVQMHDTVHRAYGISNKANDFLLMLSGWLLLKSGQALKVTHLRHHGQCLKENDPEGAPAHWTFRKVLFQGPYHLFMLRVAALKIAPKTKNKQLMETGVTLLVLAAIVLAWWRFDSYIGLVYWGVAFVMSSIMPIWATYIPHHLAPDNPLRVVSLKVVRFWTPVITSFAFHHLHHDHPRVPTALLPRVAKAELEQGSRDRKED